GWGGRGRAGAAAVGEVGEIHDRLARLRLDEQLVATGRRVDDQVTASRLRRPVRAAREHPYLAGQCEPQRLGRAAGADQADPLGLDAGDDLLVRVAAEGP